MRDQNKTKEQLINELAELRQKIAELETSESRRKQAEGALRESDERYRTLFEGSRDAIYITTKEGKFIDFNQAFLELLGFSREELLRMISRDTYVNPHDRDRFQQEIEQKEFAKDFEVKLRKKDNAEIDCLITSSVRLDNDGNILGYQGVIRDITERKRAEELLRESKEFTENLIASMKDGFSVQDRHGVHIDVNPAFCQMIGFSREELIGVGLPHPYWPPEAYEEIERVFQKTLRGEFSDFELTFIRKNGERFPVIVSSSWIKDKQGNVTSYFATVKDITELKRATEEYRTILRTTMDGFWIVDMQGRFWEVNDAYCCMIGYSRDELLTMRISDVEAVERLEETARRIQKTMEVGGDRFETGHRCKDGRIIDIEVSVNYMEVGGGRMFVFLRDITECKRAEEVLKGSTEQLRALSAHLQSIREEERTIMAREIHDELGQALTALKMDLSWVTMNLPKDQKPLHQKTKLMSKLLDTTFKTVKRISSELRPGLLDDLGLTAAIEWQAEEFQKRTGIRCEVIIKPEEIVLDEKLSTTIFRIFQETLTNASRHANAKKVIVGLTENFGRLELKVKDNGKGITEKQISSPKSLGLIGIRERVHSWGGEVKIEGKAGKGTKVTVSIPLRK